VNTFQSKLKQLRWYQWLSIAILLVYLIYIALSYLYLPDKLKQVVETDVADMIGRDIRVENIEFNPFLLSLRVTDFAIADQPERPLVGWKQLVVDFGFWKSLLSFEVGFQDIELNQPQINIVKQGERLNFTDILEKLEAQAAAEPETEQVEEDGAGLALEVVRTAINQGVFRFSDLSGATPAHSTLDDITIEVQNLYLATGDEHLNPYNIKAVFPGGGDIQLSGQYRLDPLHVESKVAAKQIQLATFSDFLYNIIPLRLSNGLLSLDSEILIEQKQELEISVNQGHIGLTALALDDQVVDPPLFRVSSLDVNGISLDLLKQSFTVNDLKIEGVSSNLWLDKDGKPRYEPILAKKIADENVEYHDKDKKGENHDNKEEIPWDILIQNASLQKSVIHFSDQNEKITQSHTLSDITLNMENFTFDPDQKVKSSLSAVLDDSGKIGSDVVMTLLPFDMDLNYQLDKLDLPSFSEYVETATYLRIEKGALSVKGNAQFSNKDDLPFSVNADAGIEGFQAEDVRTGKPVVSFQNFGIQKAIVNSSDQSIKIAKVELDKPDIRVELSDKSELNLAGLTKPSTDTPQKADSDSQTVTTSEEDKGSAEATWNYSVEAVAIKSGITHFTDHSQKPAFKIGLYDMDLNVDSIGSQQTTPTPFTFTSKIDKYAPFSVKGDLAPLDKQPGFSFSSELRGLEMTGLSPYSGKYIGSNLRSGNLSLDLDYSLQDRKLKGKNNVVAKDLYLGDKVKSEQAIKAPVALGLALLRDLDGVIDLDVGVAGDLDDPGFSAAGVVLKAFVNIIVKAAASPFSLLGSIAGGSEDMGQIEFEPGLDTLDATSQERLRQLTEALTKKPSLTLTIVGNASAAQDKEPLQKIMVQNRVADQRKISLEELQEDAGDEDWWKVKSNRKILNRIAEELNLPSESEREKQIKAQQPELSGDELEALLYQQIYSEVAANQPVDTSDLLSLADRRAIAIKQYLVDDLKFDHTRLSVDKTSVKQLTGNVVNLQLGAK